MLLALAAMALSGMRSDISRLESDGHRSTQRNDATHEQLDSTLQREMRDRDDVTATALRALEIKLTEQMAARDALIQQHSDRLDMAMLRVESWQTDHDENYPPKWLIDKVDDHDARNTCSFDRILDWQRARDGVDAAQSEKIIALERATFRSSLKGGI